ncbi:hypothetical protein P1P68_25970 [Streptomyces scabiei]|uniref:hypothetical protein n=1 Tax=Streptomyces scabiei TaxID=1930 RepID=UPI00298FE730|nr:hypothetical protein [Streptomyces scabiei]MDW8808139.1 hypothetical protein [Streptomyces scabiei]
MSSRGKRYWNGIPSATISSAPAFSDPSPRSHSAREVKADQSATTGLPMPVNSAAVKS